MRYVYLAIGLLFVGLGVIGAVLPVLPTTPFLLISLWAFAKSSPRLERWLLDHPRFGPRLVAWREHKVIPLPVKLTALASMVGSLIFLAIVGRWLAFGVSAALMAVGSAYVWTRPSKPPAEVIG